MEAPAAAVPPEASAMKGPTSYTNWVLPNLLLVGSHPWDQEDFDGILRQGVTLFICLETTKELERTNGFYFEYLKKMINAAPKRYPQKATDLQWLHFPIFDRSVTDDAAVNGLVTRLRTELAASRRVYMHCRGGHGRTGTIVSILLGQHYGLTAYEALELCQSYHDTREDVIERGLGHYRSPETHEQRDQVYRLLK